MDHAVYLAVFAFLNISMLEIAYRRIKKEGRIHE